MLTNDVMKTEEIEFVNCGSAIKAEEKNDLLISEFSMPENVVKSEEFYESESPEKVGKLFSLQQINGSYMKTENSRDFCISILAPVFKLI